MPKHLILKALFSLMPLVFFGACNTENKVQSSLSEQQKCNAQEIDSTLKYWQTIHIDQPDSAILFAQSILTLCDSLDLPQQKFYAYLMLAEIAQYTTNDQDLFLESLIGAAEVFYTNNIVKFLDPYSLINFGNHFYQLDIQQQAREYYRASLEVARNNSNQHAEALAYQNIALSFTEDNHNDSALLYFDKCEDVINQELRTIYIQNKTHIAHFYFGISQEDSALYYAKESIRLLENYKSERVEMQNNKPNAHKVAWSKLYTRCHILLMQIHTTRGETHKVTYHFEEALNKANTLCNASSYISTIYYIKAKHSNTIGKLEQMQKEASFALSEAQKYHQYELASNSASLLKDYYKNKGNKESQLFYTNLILQLNNKVKDINKSKSKASTLIYLASLAREKDKRQLELKDLKNKVTIKHQQRYIVLLLLLFFTAIAFIIAFIKQRHRTSDAYSSMVENISNEISQKRSSSSHPKSELAIKLDKLITEERVFLNKDLNLENLSSLLHTNQTYTSQLINREYEMSFSDYLNKLRAKEVCRLMALEECKDCSVQQLAERAGFSSKSTLYTAFKKHIGMSPAAFRNRLS